MSRFLCLVPAGDEWHIATRFGQLVTTTERTQIALGRIEGKRAPVIAADNVGSGNVHLPIVDLLALSLDQGTTSAPEPEPAEPPKRAVKDSPQA